MRHQCYMVLPILFVLLLPSGLLGASTHRGSDELGKILIEIDVWKTSGSSRPQNILVRLADHLESKERVEILHTEDVQKKLRWLMEVLVRVRLSPKDRFPSIIDFFDRHRLWVWSDLEIILALGGTHPKKKALLELIGRVRMVAQKNRRKVAFTLNELIEKENFEFSESSYQRRTVIIGLLAFYGELSKTQKQQLLKSFLRMHSNKKHMELVKYYKGEFMKPLLSMRKHSLAQYFVDEKSFPNQLQEFDIWVHNFLLKEYLENEESFKPMLPQILKNAVTDARLQLLFEHKIFKHKIKEGEPSLSNLKACVLEGSE